MQFFYDGQIRRYLTQTIRFFSNFVVKYEDGTLHRIPVVYGGADRQVASIMRQNSENVINSVPRISVYVKELKLDRDRMADSTYVGTLNFRNKEIDPITHSYNTNQGRTYSVERIMPTPFKLTMNVDIWASSTDQKLQILEQILVFFNPSVELQTNDNYLDWTSLSVLNLDDINWTSAQVPIGTNLTIDIATLTVDTPIWISAPAKVKQLGVITNIITNIKQSTYQSPSGFIEGLGIDATTSTFTLTDLISKDETTVEDCVISVYGDKISLLSNGETGPATWLELLENYTKKYIAGISSIYLFQADGSNIIGTFTIDEFDSSIVNIIWNPDTLVPNTGIDSQGNLDSYPAYNPASYRPNSPGTFDAIIDPLSYNPKRPNKNTSDQSIIVGTRYLLVEDIGSASNTDGPDAWKSDSGVDFIAYANDIVEWSGSEWKIIFSSSQQKNAMVWQTNIYTGVQYLWNGVSWVKSYDGEYREGEWRIVL